jgi:MinD superfamily P-loop ATPase
MNKTFVADNQKGRRYDGGMKNQIRENTLRLPRIDRKKCVLCGECIDQCPQHVLAMQVNRLVFVRPQDCTYCTTCELVCPHYAMACDFSIQWAK